MQSIKSSVELFNLVKKIQSMSDSDILSLKKIGLINLLNYALKHRLEIREAGVIYPSGFAFMMARTTVSGKDDLYAVFRNFSLVDESEVSIIKEWHSYSSGDAMWELDQFISGEQVDKCNQALGASHAVDFLSNYVGSEDIAEHYYSLEQLTLRFELFIEALEHPEYRSEV